MKHQLARKPARPGGNDRAVHELQGCDGMARKPAQPRSIIRRPPRRTAKPVVLRTEEGHVSSSKNRRGKSAARIWRM
jgi:hypothetical protein